MALTEDDDLIQTFSADRTDKTLSVRVLPRRSRRSEDVRDPHRSKRRRQPRQKEAQQRDHRSRRYAILSPDQCGRGFRCTQAQAGRFAFGPRHEILRERGRAETQWRSPSVCRGSERTGRADRRAWCRRRFETAHGSYPKHSSDPGKLRADNRETARSVHREHPASCAAPTRRWLCAKSPAFGRALNARPRPFQAVPRFATNRVHTT
jgi:hypothetical protein